MEFKSKTMHRARLRLQLLSKVLLKLIFSLMAMPRLPSTFATKPLHPLCSHIKPELIFNCKR